MSGKATAALHVACARADERGVQRALDAGADVNSLDDQHRSVLWLALLGHAEIDSAPDATTEDANRVGVLKLLLARPDINLMTLNSARIVTPLALAAWLNWPKCVNAILKESDGAAAVDCMDAGGATPLMYAARDGSVDVARILLAHGAHVDLCDANTRSVLQHALTSPQIMWMCELALRRQRLKILTKQTQHNPHDPHTASQTALLTLLSNSLPAAPLTTSSTTSPTKSSTTSAAALAAQYAPPSLSRLAPRTLASSVSQLIAAVHVGNVPLLRSLLFPPRSGVAPVGIVNLSDGQGWSALHWALRVDLPVACSRREIVEALWSAGADVGLPTLDERGERLTPLHVFARYAVDEVVGSSDVDTSTAVSPLYALTSYLIHTLKFSLTAKDGHNETPLHAAAERGFSADVLAALLDADVRGEVRAMKNDRGLTHAKSLKHTLRVCSRTQALSVPSPPHNLGRDDVAGATAPVSTGPYRVSSFMSQNTSRYARVQTARCDITANESGAA
ncbi:ankyrin repeat-containing domain protein [Auriculariales sp. MPI-PUGE-AT-0066]|nr:ankyrin repeat-containing domain protein [Auriculariales sp. MPI-PUGE-AT-0066]